MIDPMTTTPNRPTTTTTTTTNVGFKKLHDGSWGIAGTNLVTGQPAVVVKKSGERKKVIVGEIVFSSKRDGYTIAKFSDPNSAPASRRDDAPYDAMSRYDFGRGCHTDGNCSSLCDPEFCPCGDGGGWFNCC